MDDSNSHWPKDQAKAPAPMKLAHALPSYGTR